MRFFKPLTIPALAASALLTGCSSFDGIWIFYLEALLDNGCEDAEVSHNFTGAELNESTSDWDSTDEGSITEQVFFGQLFSTSPEEGYLVFGNEVYPGTFDGSVWTFTWTGSEDVTHTDSLGNAYAYSEATLEERADTIAMTLEGNTGSGTWDWAYVNTRTWVESDQWDTTVVGLNRGQIPADQYLSTYNPQTKMDEPAENTSDRAECGGSDCQISTSTSCTSTRSFTASHTGLGEEGEYEALEDAGQNAGP